MRLQCSTNTEMHLNAEIEKDITVSHHNYKIKVVLAVLHFKIICSQKNQSTISTPVLRDFRPVF